MAADYDAGDGVRRRPSARVVVEDIVSVVTVLFGILEEGKKKGIFAEAVPFLIHMMIVGTILFYKKATPIKDRQSWLPAAIKPMIKNSRETWETKWRSWC